MRQYMGSIPRGYTLEIDQILGTEMWVYILRNDVTDQEYAALSLNSIEAFVTELKAGGNPWIAE